MSFFSFLTQEIAIDLGTANTIIIHNGKVVVDEPSVVTIDTKTEKLVAIGEKARQMQGKTHSNLKTIRPLRDGVIADFNAAEQMIRGMIKMINPKKRFFAPALKMVICIPSGSMRRDASSGFPMPPGREEWSVFLPTRWPESSLTWRMQP